MLKEQMKAKETMTSKREVNNELLRITSLGAKADAVVKELIDVMGMDVEYDQTNRVGHFVAKTYVIRGESDVNLARGKRIKELVKEFLRGQYQIFYRSGNYCNILIMEQWK